MSLVSRSDVLAIPCKSPPRSDGSRGSIGLSLGSGRDIVDDTPAPLGVLDLVPPDRLDLAGMTLLTATAVPRYSKSMDQVG